MPEPGTARPARPARAARPAPRFDRADAGRARRRRRLAAEHDALDEWLVTVERHLEEGCARDAQAAIADLAAALDAHFTLEERARRADRDRLAASGRRAVERIEADHANLRAELDDLCRAATAGDVAALRSAFPVFAVALAEHEADEAALLARLAGVG